MESQESLNPLQHEMMNGASLSHRSVAELAPVTSAGVQGCLQPR